MNVGISCFVNLSYLIVVVLYTNRTNANKIPVVVNIPIILQLDIQNIKIDKIL